VRDIDRQASRIVNIATALVVGGFIATLALLGGIGWIIWRLAEKFL
jgi:hypothetical protein